MKEFSYSFFLLEVALLDDMRVLHNYAVNEFFKQTPVFISLGKCFFNLIDHFLLGLQKEDTMELAKLRLSPKVISEERVLMVTDDSQLIGFVVCSSALSDRNKQKHDRSSTDIIDLTEGSLVRRVDDIFCLFRNRQRANCIKSDSQGSGNKQPCLQPDSILLSVGDRKRLYNGNGSPVSYLSTCQDWNRNGSGLSHVFL